MTSGATQEEGIEFAPDGRSFVTSIGTSQSTLWIHDARGDRQITSEGFALLPSISADGKKLYYLRRAGARSIVNGELWVADLESGQRERLLPDFLMRHYSISPDGQRLVFVAAEESGKNPVWLAALRSPQCAAAPHRYGCSQGLFRAGRRCALSRVREGDQCNLPHQSKRAMHRPRLCRRRPIRDSRYALPSTDCMSRRTGNGSWLAVRPKICRVGSWCTPLPAERRC